VTRPEGQFERAKDASTVYVFAYGSNMLTTRIQQRVAGARPLTTGYVRERRLTFHKRGADGSAKADATFTGQSSDRVWGVVFAMHRSEKQTLDKYEGAYNSELAVVCVEGGELEVSIYVAEEAAIDRSLRPYAWYHRFVIAGAEEHRLPEDYVQRIQRQPSVTDPDRERRQQALQLLGD